MIFTKTFVTPLPKENSLVDLQEIYSTSLLNNELVYWLDVA